MKSRLLTVALHITAWVLLIIFPQFIINKYWGNSNFVPWGFYLSAAFYGIIFYINYLWLVPQFYFKQKKPIYFILAFALVAVLYLLYTQINYHFLHDPERDKLIAEAFEKLENENLIPRPPMRQLKEYYHVLTSVIIIGFAIGLRVIEKHANSEKRQKELEKEKLNSELAFLKNQVSPHFFFNTLNNIYSLIEINTKDAQESVLKLSKLMRYLLYESEHGQTSLGNEISFMNNYVDLMKLRLSNKVELKVDLPQVELNQAIPPLLFIPFIENAFKHGISYREKSFIHIALIIDNKKIIFTCTNSLVQQTEVSKAENHSGIGLENVKKRLNLLYPDKHVLRIEKTGSAYNVSLEIEVKN
jgi:two-component sensor histidine kinase